ncbi:RES family NAD+ phosphorylase [Acidiferrobacter sp.]|uniref:RES family NAD+ phosphorylase n=1 Tax=Acidiferrobacter sp. TaxID=1872107 RepID=UPI00262C45CC|nr:RES family NAD+ phosphorylase [Acidiferrobacter sp.]
MIVWRIAATMPGHRVDDLSGVGAKITGGRWNSPGRAVLYCSSSIALAALETIVHLSQGALPLNRFLVRVTIPDKLWRARETLTLAAAPVTWDALPAGPASRRHGDEWLDQSRSVVLEIPSIVVPEEYNVLVNPNHARAAEVTATVMRLWRYDLRLR